MKAFEIKNDIYWVGAVDWNRRNFHGYSLSPKGTTYNNFLIKDEKVTLIDTVEEAFKDEMYDRIKDAVGELKIDYLVVNHLEPDHAGCLDKVIRDLKPEKIFCSPMGEKAMKSYWHYEDWPVEVMKGGTEISIGKRTLQFIETRMLHWPDNMLTYCPEDKIAFTSDAFGQNLASTERFADQVDRTLIFDLMKEYYANIVLPYSPVVQKTLAALGEMNLDIDMLCPDHGLIWRGREDVAYALDSYMEFARQQPLKKAVVVYDSMWHSTEKMGLAITEGLASEGISVKVMSMKANHHSSVMTEVFDAAAVIVGSPTHNNGILPLMADMLTYMKGLRPQNKIGAAFGSFGWSGECVNILTEWLEKMSFEIIEGPIKAKNRPTEDLLEQCYEMGVKIGQAINAKLG